MVYINKWFVCVLSCSAMSNSLPSYGMQHTRLLYPWGFSMQEYWSGLPCLPPGDLPKLGIKPRSPTLQANSLPSEPPENPKNTGVGSLTLLQGIFPAQESNWGLLHCRQILYHLSYQRSPNIWYGIENILYLGIRFHWESICNNLQIILSLFIKRIYSYSMSSVLGPIVQPSFNCCHN